MLAINIGLIIVFLAYDMGRAMDIRNIEMGKKELQKKYETLQTEYTKLSNQFEEKVTYSQGLEAKMNFWEKNGGKDLQPFHAWWVADVYYLPNDSTEYECWKEITIYKDVIRMNGDDLTNKPIYNVTVRLKEEVVENIQNLGITNKDVYNLLQADCYAEIDFSMTYEWNRELLSREVDLIQDVKYYLITSEEMICVSANDGGRVYILHQSWN